MREIKFRGYADGLHGKGMHYGYGCFTDESEKLYLLQDDDRLRVVALMQFTGLFDKNGKEIYEGDILQDDEKFAGAFAVEWNTMSDHSNWSSSRGNVFEVIGNVYENPELLTI